MKKSLFIIFTALAASPLFALDPNAFALHLRKALSLDTRADIKVSSVVTPSGVGNLNMVTATIGGAPYPVYITKDEKKYIWGFAVDAAIDPDLAKSMLISLKNVHSQGSATAPVTVVEFSDLQCSHCKAAHETLKQDLYKNYTADQVRLVYKHFPLMGHDWAEAAAVASECAAQQKEAAFWDMNTYFFSNQEKITKDNLKEQSALAVAQLKLDQKTFDACVAKPSMLAKVQADKKEGASAGVSSTPTLFINGRMRRGFRDFDDIKVVIEEKLKDLKK